MDQKLFKNILSNYPSGVTIITTHSAGKDLGFTANSFISLSLDPLSILFCLSKNAGSYEYFLKEKNYVINLLANSQKDLCNKFASKIDDKFKETSISRSQNFVPIINGSLGYLEVQKSNVIDGGDHSIFICNAKDGNYTNDIEPLIYHNRTFK